MRETPKTEAASLRLSPLATKAVAARLLSSSEASEASAAAARVARASWRARPERSGR